MVLARVPPSAKPTRSCQKTSQPALGAKACGTKAITPSRPEMTNMRR